MWTLAFLMLAQAPADVTYRIQATAPITLTIPARPEGEGHWVRVAGKRWVKVKAERQPGTLSFRLDPAQWAGGETLLVVGKEPGVDLSDEQAPNVTALTVDGRKVPDAVDVDLDWRAAPPGAVVWQIEDASRLDTPGLRVSVNGRALPPNTPGVAVTAAPGGRKATITLAPAKLPGLAGVAEARLSLTITDAAPMRNALERAVSYHLMAPSSGKPIEARVDSCFDGYTADPLLDGKVMEPGISTSGVTWASAETHVPHWVTLVFDKPRPVAGVELFWAHYSGQYWTSALYTVEYWDGARWKRLVEAKGEKPAKSTVHPFPAVTTSAIRIRQPAGGGNPGRPDIMWLTEIKPI